MAGQNDFLIFDENRDNMLSQDLYQSDADRADGFKKGLARSNVNNKVLHQTSMMCHAIGEIGKENGVIVSDEGSVEDLKTALKYSFSGADRELSNLTEEGEKHFLNKSQITNCITEIPQRIKLELVDGAAILKAGSVVIVPNGADTFDYVTIETDLTCPNGGSGTNTDAMLFYNAISKTLTYGAAASVTSGTTAPTGSGYFYDTTNNVINYYSNGTPQGYRYAFPVALVTRENGAFTTVKNLFNGMGYIGSTVWVDKGVKGLIPNGRNADGSLKNIEVTSDKLYLRTYTTGINNTNVNFIFQPNNTERPIGYVLSSRLVSNWEGINYIKDVNGTIYQGFMYATGDVTNGVITSFNPKQPFRAVDYNDIAGLKAYIVDTYQNGTSWYRVWSDGWIEQGGYTTNSGFVTLLQPFSNTNYNVTFNRYSSTEKPYSSDTDKASRSTVAYSTQFGSKSTNGFYLEMTRENGCTALCWRACGN